jgi:transposase
MENSDLRKISDSAREELRKTAIRLINKGEKKGKVAEMLGCHPRTITNWWKAYKTEGFKSIKPKTRGRREGEKRRLTIDQEKSIQKMLKDKYPDQLKLPYALWTRSAVQELILLQYGIQMPIRTVGDYLRRWGFTPQKPIRRAYEQQPEKVQKWLTEHYPAIKARAKSENAEIQWCDETGFSSEDNRGRGYSPKGVTPVTYGTGSRFSTSMISSINNQGQMRWMVYKGAMHIDLFIKFLRRLIKDSERKVFLIVDNLRTHHSIKVRKWVEKHKDEIELFYLPAYSPELNPDEYVNNDVKTNIKGKPAARNQQELQNNVRSYMRSLQWNKTKVAKFFNHEKVRYAKAS